MSEDANIRRESVMQITPVPPCPPTIAQVTEIFYNDISTVLSTAAKGILIYIALIAMLRITGKRSLSKFNIFDFVITIALGSVFASTLTSSDVKLAQSITAIVILLGGQYIHLATGPAFGGLRKHHQIRPGPALLGRQPESRHHEA